MFLGHSVSRTQNISEETARKIDSEVKMLVQAGHTEAKRILQERIEDLHTLAKALLEYETLTGEEIGNALKGIPPVRDDAEADRPSGPSVSVPLTPVKPPPSLAGPDPQPA